MRIEKLSEIKLVPEQPTEIDIAAFDSPGTLVRKVEGYDLMRYTTSLFEGQVLYCLESDEKELIGSIVGIEYPGSPIAFKINKTAIAKKYQNKGYAKSMYDCLFRHVGYNLYSDQYLTAKTLNGWKKGWGIASIFMCAFNVVTKEHKKLSDISEKELTSDEDWIFCLSHVKLTENWMQLDVRLFDTITITEDSYDLL